MNASPTPTPPTSATAPGRQPLDEGLNHALDHALHAAWAHTPEPADSGFSLAVMGALPQAAAPSPRHRHWARRLRWLQWSVSSAAACTAGWLWSHPAPTPAELAAGGTLLALLALWHSPHPWRP